MVRHGIDLGSPAMRAFCRKWQIAELAVFGSILRDDYRTDSDVDFVITYEGGVRPRFHEVLDMEEELSALVGRPVDVVEREQLDDPDANPIRRREILRTLEESGCDRRGFCEAEGPAPPTIETWAQRHNRPCRGKAPFPDPRVTSMDRHSTGSNKRQGLAPKH